MLTFLPFLSIYCFSRSVDSLRICLARCVYNGFPFSNYVMCTDCVITQIMDIVWMVFRMKIGTITKPSTSFHSVDKTQFVFNKDLKNTWQLKTLKKITKIMTNPILLDWSRNWRSERTRDTVNWIAKRKIPFIAIFVFFYLDKVTVDELHIAHKSIIFRSEFYALTHIHRQTIKKGHTKTNSVGGHTCCCYCCCYCSWLCSMGKGDVCVYAMRACILEWK